MTAEIGILNKTSVVLAADSAATVVAHKKVFNTANKLFPLSNYEPVGVMVYNLSNWMGIPLEIIIKSYTKKLEDNSFSSLVEYRDDFIKFLKENFKKFVDEKQIIEVIEIRLHDILHELIDKCTPIFDKELVKKPHELNEDEKKALFETIFFDVLNRACEIKDDILPEFSNYELPEFKNDFKKTIDKILPGFYSTNNITRKAIYTQNIYKILYHELICKFSEDEDYTGIVIAGYGNDEIFPTICDIKIGEILTNRLRYEISTEKSISNNKSAIVSPYAQRDMVDTFFSGMSLQLLSQMNKILIGEFENVIDKIYKKYPEVVKSEIRPFFKTLLKNLNTNTANYSKKNITTPIIKSIGFLKKEDLIELAESLINITSIKRKTSDELQSVGGPIDIAIITKYEGFIWIKKKEIVNRELNSAFYNREFKKYK